jgi:inositol phosphorylceramide mannosyltransferase catalytic subunit
MLNIQPEAIPIPKKIFQTHKSQEYINSDFMLKIAQRSWTECTDYEYHFYNDAQQDAFMKEHFSNIYDIYKALPIKVMKADLWRYCVIYKYGGIYTDADTVCLGSPDDLIKDASLVCGPEDDTIHLCQWTFAAPAQSPIIKSIIDVCIERLTNHPEKYKESPHFIHFYTGPGAFTTGIERCLQRNNVPLCKNKKEYRIVDTLLFVHDFETFHTEIVEHLFKGQDGWCKERDAYFESIS